jgi:hypothetical protein
MAAVGEVSGEEGREEEGTANGLSGEEDDWMLEPWSTSHCVCVWLRESYWWW